MSRRRRKTENDGERGEGVGLEGGREGWHRSRANMLQVVPSIRIIELFNRPPSRRVPESERSNRYIHYIKV